MRSTTTIAVSIDTHRRLADRHSADMRSMDDVVMDLLDKADELKRLLKKLEKVKGDLDG